MSQLPIGKQYLISSLKEFDEEILSKKYLKSSDEQTCTHDNKEILDKFNVSDNGTLLYDGKEIGSSSSILAGKSAYEIAQDNGFEGTEEEWLESLKGEKGSAGNNGKDGVDGQHGDSAYQIAVDNGFQGSEEEWLDSLRGKDAGYEILTSTFAVQENTEEGKLVDALVVKEVFQSVSEGKSIIASAITDKGIETDASATFAMMAENIGQIVTGSGEDSGNGGSIDNPLPVQVYFSGYIGSKKSQYRTVMNSTLSIKKVKKIVIRSFSTTASLIYISASGSSSTFYFKIYGTKNSVSGSVIKQYSVTSSSAVGGTPGSVKDADLEIDMSDWDSIDYWEITVNGATTYYYIYNLSLKCDMEIYT